MTGGWRWAAVIVGAGLLLGLVGERLWLVPVHVSFDANEGWNAFQAARAFGEGGPLYPPPDALTGDNYPPLSFLIVGGISQLAGLDAIVTGRMISVLGLAATAVAAAWAVRRWSPGRWVAPAATAAVILGFAATQFRAYLAMNDPQWLAHGIMTPALVLLIPRAPDRAPDRARTAATAALVVVGLFVKHNLVALPLAATLWLALRHRHAFWVWSVTGVALCGAAALGLITAYGWDGPRDVLAAPRRGSWVRMVRAAAGPLAATLPLIVVSAGLWRLRRGDPRVELPLLFVATAVPIGVLQRFGQGVNFNAHFEALVALAVCIGVVLSRLDLATSPRLRRAAVAGVVLPFVGLAPLAAAAAREEVVALPRERVAWRQLETRIAEAPGPVACETLALCFWAGRPYLLDVFLYGQRLAAGADDAALRHALATGVLVYAQREPGRPFKAGEATNPVLTRLDRGAAIMFTAADGRRLEALRR